jgi:hypothetical protein
VSLCLCVFVVKKNEGEDSLGAKRQIANMGTKC